MRKRVIMAISFLMVGVLIYFLFNVGLISKSNLLLTIIRNYIPDICWTFSFFFMSINFSKNITKYDLLLNSLFIIVISLTYETLQFYNIVGGSFDIIDITLYFMSIIVSCLIEIKIRRRENEKN